MGNNVSTGGAAQPYFFSAIALLETPTEIQFEALRAAAGRLHPKVAENMTGYGGAGVAARFQIGSAPVTILRRDRPMAAADLERAHLINKIWPEAKDELARHSAHVIVTAGVPVRSHPDALAMATFTTVTLAAIVETCPALGVFWPASQALMSPALLRQATAGLARSQPALSLWLRPLIFVTKHDQAGRDYTVAVCSEGLRPFVGYEVEATARNTRVEDLVQLAGALGQRLIAEGLSGVSDGARFGDDSIGRCRLRFRASSPYRAGLPVIELHDILAAKGASL